MIDASIVLQGFMEKIGKIFDNYEVFDDLISSIRENTDQLGLDLVREYLICLDNETRKSAHRKKEWAVERKADRNGILTEMGMLNYERTYYVSKAGGEYAYLVDACVGIAAHQRIAEGLRDKLVKTASDISYEKTTGAVGREKVSRQTVKRAVHSFDPDMIKHEIIPGNPGNKKKVPYLYIDADEDHVSVRNKGRSEQKLIYVYEGKAFNKKEGKSELVNKYVLTRPSGTELFLDAYEYIRNNYDLDEIKRIYIQGDGAHWIKAGTNIIPNSRFVLDKFHMMKHAGKCTGTNRELMGRLWRALMESDICGLDVVMNDVLESVEEGKREGVLKDFKYFYSNFDGIRIYADPKEKPVGCSAESHVSHILSHRLSSRPLTWSAKGADNIARLRVCIVNGGNVADIRRGQAYVRGIEENKIKRNRFMTDGHGLMYDVYHNIEVLRNGHVTRLYKALKSFRGA